MFVNQQCSRAVLEEEKHFVGEFVDELFEHQIQFGFDFVVEETLFEHVQCFEGSIIVPSQYNDD